MELMTWFILGNSDLMSSGFYFLLYNIVLYTYMNSTCVICYF